MTAIITDRHLARSPFSSIRVSAAVFFVQLCEDHYEERSGVRITVLGKSPSWQDAGGACSGYLVEEDDYALLLDCGNGVFSKLRRFRDYVDVGAVLISHLHADHLLDLVPFSYALQYAPRQQPVAVGGWPGTTAPARPELYAPKGAGDMFRHLVECWGDE